MASQREIDSWVKSSLDKGGRWVVVSPSVAVANEFCVSSVVCAHSKTQSIFGRVEDFAPEEIERRLLQWEHLIPYVHSGEAVWGSKVMERLIKQGSGLSVLMPPASVRKRVLTKVWRNVRFGGTGGILTLQGNSLDDVFDSIAEDAVEAGMVRRDAGMLVDGMVLLDADGNIEKVYAVYLSKEELGYVKESVYSGE